MTTKSGGDRFHGNISDYFNNQALWTHSQFNGGTKFAPFHSNNMSGHDRRPNRSASSGVFLLLDRTIAGGEFHRKRNRLV